MSDPDGDGVANPDPQCWNPWNEEAVPPVGCGYLCGVGCGLGFELAMILPGLMWLHRRRRRLH